MLEGHGGRKVKLIEGIGSQWKELAVALGFEQDIIDMIISTHLHRHHEACHEMLARWLEGDTGQVSWTTFIQSLITAGLPDLADSLNEILL